MTSFYNQYRNGRVTQQVSNLMMRFESSNITKSIQIIL